MSRRLARPALLFALCLAGGCDVVGRPPPFEAYYLDRAAVILEPDPEFGPPHRLESGDHWLIYLTAFQKGGGLISGRGRQTTVILDFAGRPALDTPIDLATGPLQASYEYGGEASLYVSRTVSGTLTLASGPAGSYQASLDATFSNPILGQGTQVVQQQLTLQKHPHPDFTTP